MKKLKFKDFSKFKDNFELPNLLDIQIKSFEDFLQLISLQTEFAIVYN